MRRSVRRNMKRYACSFCRKDYTEVGPLVQGADGSYICGECVELCQVIIEQERRRRNPSPQPSPAPLRPRLDAIVAGQDDAKKVLISAAARHSDSGGRVLLVGASTSTKLLLARALAHVLEVPFVAGNADDLTRFERGSTLFDLLASCDFDIAVAQRGVAFLAGAERPEAQEALLQLWREPICRLGREPNTLEIDLREMLFVCGAAFAEVDKRLTAEALIELGCQRDWVACLSGMAKVAPLDEATLLRLAAAADFDACERRDKPAAV
jgi:ATP-dependent Clp protease ATP-binding subunit ClpX